VVPDSVLKQGIGHLRRGSISPDERGLIEKKLLIKQKNFQILEAFNKPWYSTQAHKKAKLGSLFKATLKMQENHGPSTDSIEQCICRVIEFDRMTNYVIEDYLSELAKFELLKLKKFMMPTLAIYLSENGLNLFQPQMISLFEYLHCEEKQELRRQMSSGDKY
jgi:hypothetical protein